MSVVHSFTESNNKVSAIEDQFYFDIYSRIFNGIAGVSRIVKALPAQKAGIDRTITLNTGAIYSVDEKTRYQDYNDILLERWSNKDREVAGWVQKDLLADFILYCVHPSGKAVLLPVPQLRKAWRRYGREWIKKAESEENNGFKIVTADNREGRSSWVSESVCVPEEVLLKAISDCLTVPAIQRDSSYTIGE